MLFYRKKNAFVLTLLAILIFAGCKKVEKGQIKYNYQTIKASFSTAKDIVWRDSIIDPDIEYIKLEDTKEPIGEIKKIIIENNKIIIWDNARKNIFVFTDKGKFLSQIARFGNGAQEYNSIYNISFTAPNRINVIDGQVKTINIYSIDGKFLGKKQADGFISDYLDFQNRKFWFNYETKDNKHGYYLDVEEEDKSRIGFFEYQKQSFFAQMGGDFFMKAKGLVYLRQPYNDTIFTYKDRVLYAKYVFDFGENKYPSKALHAVREYKQLDGILSKKRYEGNLSKMIISNKYLVSYFNQQINAHEAKTAVLIHNLLTNVTLTYTGLGGGKGQIVPSYPMATDGDNFYSVYSPLNLPEPLNSSYKNYGVNSNPIIIKYKYHL